MLQENKIIELLPQVLSGDRLIEELWYLPAYNETIIEQSQASRLLALSDIYRVYVPSEMSIEIYNKLYLALLLSIKKKFTAAAVKQRYENAKMIKRMDSVGIIGGSDSFTIIGSSGLISIRPPYKEVFIMQSPPSLLGYMKLSMYKVS